MPAALIQVIAGRYAGAYTPPAGGALSMGILNDDGFELAATPKGEEINATDAYGLSLLDFVYRGADWRLRARAKEFAADLMKIVWPWGMGTGALSPRMGVIGRRGSDIAGSMVLTATTGTPAASSPGPASLTAGLCVASPNANMAMYFTSKARDVPAELVLLPYSDGGSPTPNVIWFSVS